MYSVQIAVSDGTLTRIALSIEYFEKDDITLYRNLELTPLVLGTDWQWDGDTHINLLTNIPVPLDSYITVRRNTNIDRAFNIYDGGAAFSRDTLDENFKQMIYLAQEFTEGNGLTGLFFPLDMHGFRITNLGDGIDPKDAVNKGQLDVVDDRVTSLEQSFVTDTISYPWYELTTSTKDTFSPPFQFAKAAVYVDGVCQIPGYSYIVVSNQILLADPVPAGTLFFARLGEDVGLDPDYATADQLAAAISNAEAAHAALQADIDSKAGSGVNSDITELTGLTTPLSVGQGGTGNVTGEAPSATVLATARNIQVALNSTSAASFDGSADTNPGVSGTLPVANGGTGATSPASARANIGASTVGDAVFTAANAAAARTTLGSAQSGTNADITQLTTLSGGVTGLVTGVAAATGIVGQEVSANSGSAVTLASGVLANVISISLPAGDWELDSALRVNNAGNVTALTFGVSQTSAVLPTNWWDLYNITTTMAAGSSSRQGMRRRVLLSVTTTLYLVVQCTFNSTCTADGYIRARRMR